jgi:hypothetical protein
MLKPELLMTEQNTDPLKEHPCSESAAERTNEGGRPDGHKEQGEVLLEQQAEILREEVQVLKEEVELLEEELEVVELELFCKENPGQKPPRAKKYRIRVDKVKIDMPIPDPTGRQILDAAGKVPPERWLLNQKICGQMKPVGLDEKVDLTAPGVERFVTLPKDQTEGRPAARRLFALPEEDTELLDAGGYYWETVEGGGRWLLIHDFALPPGFSLPSTSAAIQIPSGYPSAALDMVFFHPAVVRSDGRVIPATQASVAFDGKQWQRWSRHYTAANPWRSGEYNVVTHLNLACTWLQTAASQ